MSMPFYVSPEQLMKDRADFARKGIARGRSVVVVQYADGVLFASENPSQALHKVSEIYDRIAFGAVGRYNEFENLRIAGVRLADMRGYAYDRRDVTGRGLANAYAQTLGTIFSSGGEKPYEVELFVAEIGEQASDDQIYRLTYDGQVADEHGFAVMGGAADVVAAYFKERYVEGASLEDALRLAVAALGHTSNERGESDDRVIPAEDLEVAVLDRTRTQPRKFRRILAPRLTELLGKRGPSAHAPDEVEDAEPGAASTAPSADDPADPTDQVSGATPPLENPVTGEPTAPPSDPGRAAHAPPLRRRLRRRSARRTPSPDRPDCCRLVPNGNKSAHRHAVCDQSVGCPCAFLSGVPRPYPQAPGTPIARPSGPAEPVRHARPRADPRPDSGDGLPSREPRPLPAAQRAGRTPVGNGCGTSTRGGWCCRRMPCSPTSPPRPSTAGGCPSSPTTSPSSPPPTSTGSRPRRPGLICSRLDRTAQVDAEPVLRHGQPVDLPEEVLLRAARDLAMLDLVPLVDSALRSGDTTADRLTALLRDDATRRTPTAAGCVARGPTVRVPVGDSAATLPRAGRHRGRAPGGAVRRRGHLPGPRRPAGHGHGQRPRVRRRRSPQARPPAQRPATGAATGRHAVRPARIHVGGPGPPPPGDARRDRPCAGASPPTEPGAPVAAVGVGGDPVRRRSTDG